MGHEPFAQAMMLSAIRLAVYGRFKYRIDSSDARHLLLSDRAELAEILRQYGFGDPEQLIRHVETWGSIQLVDPNGS
jgi:hypothetical protein